MAWGSDVSLFRCGGVFAVLAVAAICMYRARARAAQRLGREQLADVLAKGNGTSAVAANGGGGRCDDCSHCKPSPSKSGPKEKWMPTLMLFGFLGPFGMQQAAGFFALYALRIFIVPLWDSPYYIPVLSPLYGQGKVWLETHERTLAILVHVGSGSIALLCGVRQFNRTLRHRKPALHRVLGRVYVVAGLICVCSLVPLWSTIGRGTSKQPSRLVQGMTLVTNTCWVIATASAVRHARAGRYEQHRKVCEDSRCYGRFPRAALTLSPSSAAVRAPLRSPVDDSLVVHAVHAYRTAAALFQRRLRARLEPRHLVCSLRDVQLASRRRLRSKRARRRVVAFRVLPHRHPRAARRCI